jgi:hypothetical protein
MGDPESAPSSPGRWGGTRLEAFDDRERSARGTAEVRWFLRGDLPERTRPATPGRRRLDSYHLDSCSPHQSLKRRGRRGPYERKVRTGRVELIEHDRLVGFAECWVKQRHAIEDQCPVGWIDVRKEVWGLGDVEVCRLRVGAERWWSVAVLVRHGQLRPKTLRAVAPWSAAIGAEGFCGSYPSWLLAQLHRSSLAVPA